MVPSIQLPGRIQIFTDGGRRDDWTAVAAWAIFNIIINGGFKLAGTGALFLMDTDSVQAEVIAVEIALNIGPPCVLFRRSPQSWSSVAQYRSKIFN